MGERFAARRPQFLSGWVLPGILAWAGGWSGSLQAAQLDFTLGYRAEYSDNLARIPNEREAEPEVINSASAQLSFLENTSTLLARMQVGATYDHYYHDTFDNQTGYFLDAYGEAFFVERTLSWMAADGFRKVQVDPLAPNTPATQQNSNAWITGPNIHLRLSSVDTVSFEARYGSAWVESLEIDNDRTAFAARWAHRVSTRTTYSLNYEYLGVDFVNDDLYLDLTRHNAFLRADIRDTRSQLTLDLGWTRIDREGLESDGNWLAHLTLSRHIGALANMGVRYRREYADTGGELIPSAPVHPVAGPGFGSGVVTLGADVISSEPYYLEQVDLFYARRGATFPWSAQLFYRDVDYLATADDREEKGASLTLSYIYSGTVSVQLLSTYSVLSYSLLAREDNEGSVGVFLAYRLTPHLQAGLEARRYGRNSTTPGQDYTDNRFALTLTYNSRPAGR